MSPEALIPIYILVILGFALVKSGYVPQEVIRPANHLVVNVFVPVFIFLTIFDTAAHGSFHWPFVFGYGIASIAAITITAVGLMGLFQKPAADAMLFSLAAGGSNSIFIGFPLVAMAYASLAGPSLSWVLLVENLVLIPGCLVLFDTLRARGQGFGAILLNLVKNPIFIALIAGVLASLVITNIWGPLEVALTKIKQATAATSLILVGGMLARSKLGGDLAAVSWVVFGKLALHPIAVLLAFAVFGIEGDLLIIGVSFAAISCFGVYANFCETAGRGPFGASVFFLSTCIAPVSIWGWLMLARLI